MVAVGIIVLLIGIAFPVFQIARTTALQAEARSTLNALETAEVEFESASGRRIWHLDGSALDYDNNNGSSISRYYDPTVNWASTSASDRVDRTAPGATGTGMPSSTRNSDGYPEQYIERFIALANQLPASRTAWVAAADGNSRVDTDDDGFDEIVDPWDTPVVYASFVSHTDGDTDDDFLPQRGELIDVSRQSVGDVPRRAALVPYVPVAPAPFFASAGPDGEFGDESADDGSPEKAAAEDNIYSFTAAKEGN